MHHQTKVISVDVTKSNSTDTIVSQLGAIPVSVLVANAGGAEDSLGKEYTAHRCVGEEDVTWDRREVHLQPRVGNGLVTGAWLVEQHLIMGTRHLSLIKPFSVLLLYIHKNQNL